MEKLFKGVSSMGNESIMDVMEMSKTEYDCLNNPIVNRCFKTKVVNGEESSLYLSRVSMDTCDEEFMGYPCVLSEKLIVLLHPLSSLI